MKRLVALALLAAGCECGKPTSTPPATPTEVPRGLHVSMPDGWTGARTREGLDVGVKGRVVLELELASRPMPTVDALTAAIGAESVEVLKKESESDFVGVRYAMKVSGVRQEAFLGVRQAGPHTIWCSTAAGARSDEVELAINVCRTVSEGESP